MTAPNQHLLEFKAVDKSYGDVRVLTDINLSIEDGEFLTILGPSGSGKTTILRLIGGFTEPNSGQILFVGESIAHVPIFHRPFNTVFQDYALFPHMTAGENIGYGLRVRGVRKREVRERVARALSVVALAEFEGRYPAQLSGGQRQRVALARALILEPRLLLLDEPLGALDAELRRQMQTFLMKLQKEMLTTFLFVTHDQEEAITMSDRICVMRDGHIEQVGPPTEIYYRPRTVFVANFFGDNNLIEGTLGAADGGTRAVDTPLGSLCSVVESYSDVGVTPAGTPVKLAVRPESIRLAREDLQADNRLQVRIEEIRFVGPISHVVTRPDSGSDVALTVKLPSKVTGAEFCVGDEAVIGWDAVECSVVVL